MTEPLSETAWLLGEEASRLLAELHGVAPTPAAIERTRAQLGGGPAAAARAGAVFRQLELRERGRAKFAAAEQMLFTSVGLEQSTDQWIAAYKAARFGELGTIVDACCGVGGDLIALGRQCEAIGVDADSDVAAFAERNALVCGVEVETRTLRLNADNLPECDAWHADPDRRATGRRTTRPDAHEPSLAVLEAWHARTPDAAVKLAPAAKLSTEWTEQVEQEWISRDGECRQLVAWCGGLANEPGQRSATRVWPDGSAATFAGDAATPVSAAERIDAWLHEPDAAVRAAGLVGALAERIGVGAPTPAIAYLTGPVAIVHPLVASFRVIDILPLDRKRLAGWLSERRIGRLEIKCRGVDIRPEKLRQQLKPRGDREATLIVFPRADGRAQVVVAERAGNNAGPPPLAEELT